MVMVGDKITDAQVWVLNTAAKLVRAMQRTHQNDIDFAIAKTEPLAQFARLYAGKLSSDADQATIVHELITAVNALEKDRGA